jgi:hypothetical protein
VLSIRRARCGYRSEVRRSRVVALVGTGVALTAPSRHALAQPIEADLAIDCPGLGDSGGAALEARARAEIAGVHGVGDRVSITCATGSATLSRTRSGSVVNQRVVQLGDDASANVDAMLESLHTLLTEEASLATVSPTPVGVMAPPAVSDTEATRESGGFTRFGAFAGGRGELWQGTLGAALGFHAGAELRLSRSWSLVALVGPAWGIGGGSVHAWTLNADVRLDGEILPHVVFGLGVSGRILWANVDASGQSAQVGTTGGALLTARVRTSLGPLVLSGGPQLDALLRPLVIDVGGAEAFRVPTLLASLLVDVATKGD